MSITWQTISGVDNQEKFKDFVYSILKGLEANPKSWLKPVAMSGTSGITIGIGFDLKNGAPASLIAVLKAMGLQTYIIDKRKNDPTSLSASETLEVGYIDQLLGKMQGNDINALNNIMHARGTDQNLINAMAAEGKNYTLRDKFRFENLNEVKYAYDNGGYEAYRVQADGFVGSSVTSQENYLLSKERAALIVVSWLSPHLAKDVASSMKAGNRAEAWFKIRYTWTEGTGANYQYNNGWAKRHYFEAQMFGLYDNPDNVTSTEAQQIFKMLQSHRLEIARREALYGIAFDGTSGTSLDKLGRTPLEAARQDYKGLLPYVEKGAIQDLLSAFQPAKEKLLADLRSLHPEIADKLSDSSFISTNIYLNPHKDTDTDRTSILDSLAYETGLFINGADDLMIGMDQKDILIGRKGHDVLIGEGGNDVLVGGEGNDVLYGGAGDDYFFGGQGNDTMYGGLGNDTYFGLG